MKALVLFSGGLDSTVCLAWAVKKYGASNVYALHFKYGQKSRETGQVAKIAKALGVKNLDTVVLPTLYGGSLTGKAIKFKGLPKSYIPSRNIVFIAFAANRAVCLGANEIWTGINAVDYSGYPDCRPDFAKAMNVTLSVGLPRKINLVTPLLRMDKKMIVDQGRKLVGNKILGMTWSCYKGGPAPCNQCPACKLRAKGFDDEVLS